ncbi:methylaspartate mutase [Sphaerisporangium corydalis]|uniref:Methylaspartate mutase n=1 Tax=Sphaerisporangium corydalis TaxID=1441875 RepID=A0ABV9EE47_9ACTN|nr:methylaspartate mutase [Sphaerisporangium corydalis]
MSAPAFGRYIADARAAGRLVVQPRMGFGSATRMRTGLAATKRASATTVGTITLDSYTRLGAHDAARRALTSGAELNGYPIVAHDAGTTEAMLAGIRDETFPVQVRHGSPTPELIFQRLCELGLTVSEGGPVSYCLPYSRVPLAESRRSWRRCCEILVNARGSGPEPHLETFGGCMLGQLCPPGLLVATSVLEGMFFRQNGLRSISLSYAQQISRAQDEEALRALRRLGARFLPGVDWHVVLYAYMGLYPRTRAGADALLAGAARLAVRAGADRLIVKTAAESARIPTIKENVTAIEHAAREAAGEREDPGQAADTGIHAEALAIVEAVLDLDDDIGGALEKAFRRGYLDIPYCLHPDNAGRATSYLDTDDRLRWRDTGRLPVPEPRRDTGRPLGAAELLECLGRVRRRFDHEPMEAPEARTRWEARR